MEIKENYTLQLNNALKTPVLKFDHTKSEQTPDNMKKAIAFLMLVHDEKKFGNTDKNKHKRILEHINSFTRGGNEPSCDVMHQWSFEVVCFAIALAKRTDTIWAELTEDVKNRLTFIMKVMALRSNFMTNDVNDYRTGLTFRGDIHK